MSTSNDPLANFLPLDEDERLGREVYKTREQRIRNAIIRFGEVVSRLQLLRSIVIRTLFACRTLHKRCQKSRKSFANSMLQLQVFLLLLKAFE